MNATSTPLSENARENLLKRIATDGLMQAKLATVAESALYRVQEGWQLAYLKETGGVLETLDSEAFEAAVRDTGVVAILVPKTAAMTREIAERILNRNGQPKTIFWET